MSSQGRSLRILVAEDNLINQKVTIGQLAKLGFTGEVVTNGQEVLEKLHEATFDVILMDCQMPEMDGFEATAAVRAMEAEGNHRTRIIAITAHAMEGDRERCLAASMDDYISKPVDIKELERALLGASPSATRSPIAYSSLDASVIETLREMEILEELVELFTSDSRNRFAQLSQAVERSDSEATRQAAHALKGSALNLGAEHLAKLLGDLERKAAEASTDGTTTLLKDIEIEFEQVIRELEASIS